ncbi:MAG: Rrf2 family transcriptional regulator [Phycisphaeraceae bacterium]|nr:Rrf2 family transcriptional regulator [Phycisphaeraceae bacterium]MCW5755267.1 Rrf2 family transcriptional regulator [Phycisphaeraceae bacterium]
MISHTSEYALRAAICLAARKDDSPASANEIAQNICVPVGYLQKILRMLARYGILTSQRGIHGGFALAKLPSEISILDILTASETQLQRITRCPLGIEGHTKLCSLHRLLDQEMARAEKTFAATTLADLLDGQGGVRHLCDVSGRLPVAVTIDSPARPSSPPGV